MMDAVLSAANDPLKIFRELGSAETLLAKAGQTLPAPAPDNNAHLHLPPNFSAFRTVAEAMQLADAQNCRIVGASNYYDFETYRAFAVEARRRNVFPLFGIEIICMHEDLRAAGIKINDPGNPGKMYICGKGMTRWANMPAEAKRILDVICRTDAERTAKLVERVSQILSERGMPNTIRAADVIDLVVRRHGVPRETVFLQERHVALAFQEHIFAHVPAAERMTVLTKLLGVAPKVKSPDDSVGVQNEIRSHLMKAGKIGYVDETFIDFAPAMQLIRELGGFPSYPILGDSVEKICPFESTPEALAENLRARGIHATEFIAVRNRVDFMMRYTPVLRKAGIIVTAGTEHNLLEMIPVAPTASDGPLPEELRRTFYEGACVIAAHQFLAAHGQAGYTGGEAQIERLAKMGHEVMGQYLKAAHAG